MTMELGKKEKNEEQKTPSMMFTLRKRKDKTGKKKKKALVECEKNRNKEDPSFFCCNKLHPIRKKSLINNIIKKILDGARQSFCVGRTFPTSNHELNM